MADQNQNFDPFVDWEEITDEMVADLHMLINAYKDATERFRETGNREDAIAVLRGQEELNSCHEAILRTLLTVPAMVHIAGPVTTEPCDNQEHMHTVQRCTRCGSALQMWREGLRLMTPSGPVEVSQEDVEWWDEGTRVAKATAEDAMTLYKVEDGELDKHEHLCPDFAGQLGDGPGAD